MKIFTRKWLSLLLATVLAIVAGCGDEGGSNPGGGNGGTASVVDPNTVVRGTFTDSRDGQTYKTVKIGSQTWMAQNLNYRTESGSWCYGEGRNVWDFSASLYELTLSSSEIQANCDTYGRLYDWATAMDIDTKYNEETWGGSDVGHRGVCPTGWHVSSVLEWDILTVAVGGSIIAGKKLKATSGWSLDSNTDEYGWSALPGGGCCLYEDLFDEETGKLLPDTSKGIFSGEGEFGGWWTATEDNDMEDYDGGCVYYMSMYSYDIWYTSGDIVYEDCWGKWWDSPSYSVRCVRDD